MDNIWFFDRYGTATLFFTGGRFVDKYGRNLGYIYQNDKIYNYRGKHCGWIEGGIIRDLNGLTIAFCIGANDYPSPILPIPQIPPIPPIPQIPYIKPIKGFGWSPLSPLELFD